MGTNVSGQATLTSPCRPDGRNNCPGDLPCMGAWSECDSNCSKTFTMDTLPTEHGTPCPDSPQDCNPGEGQCPYPPCTVSNPTGTCSSTLENGQSCMKACDDGYSLTGGTSCNDGTLTDTAECNGDRCNVLASLPSNLGNCPSTLEHGESCTKACESGYTLTPSEGDTTSCNAGTLTDTAECTENIDCVGNWGDRTPCSDTCGGGTQTRTYTISQDAQNGEPCIADDGDTESRACNSHECPIDCVGSWSDCVENPVANPPAGKVTCIKTFNVTEDGNEDGARCDEDHGATKTYCPKDDWNNSDDHSRWVPSSDTCDCWPGTTEATYNNNKRCVPDTTQTLENPYPVPPSQIRTNGTWFMPLNMSGQGRSAETGTTAEKASKCQERCRNTDGCVYFNSFSNGGCHISDGSAGEQRVGGNPTARSGRAIPEGFENFDNYEEGNGQWKGCIFIIIMIMLVLIVFNCRKK